MKNILVVAVVLLFGTGCTVLGQDQAAKNQVITYTNSVGNYSFSHPEYLLLNADNQPATEESNPLIIVEVPKGQIAEENTASVSSITVEPSEKSTEDKLAEIIKTNFAGHTDVVTATSTVSGKDAWEVVAPTAPHSVVLVSNDENYIIIYKSSQSEAGKKLVQSLQFTK